MKHYIFTRFNKDWKSKSLIKLGNGKEIDSDIWLKQRFEIFKKYYVPSILNQTCSNFEVVLLISKNTPNNIVKYIEEVGFTYITTSFLDWMKSKDLSDGILITTGLDNDDCVALNFVESIQKNAAKYLPILVDTKGYIYHNRYKKYYEFSYENNNSHFISVICDCKQELRHVLEDQHTLMHKRFDNQIKLKNTYWCEVIHKYNFSNNIRGVECEKTEKLLIE